MTETNPVAGGSRIQVWDGFLRLFHWLLVVAIAVAFLSAEENSPLNSWHIMAGWSAAILIAFRLLWGFVGGEYARFSGMFREGGLGHHIGEMVRLKPAPAVGHNPLGWISALLLIAVTAAVIWTGAMIVSSSGEAAEELHEVIGWSLLALVAVHILAVVVMSVLTRENLIRAMVTGAKPAKHHPEGRDARAPSLFAYLAGFAVVVAALFGILRIDPQAFVPRSTESAEYGEHDPGKPYQNDDEHEETREDE
ncbi:cytochrome b/b6 domain-containing protein [Parasphingorhabdus sp.]|uniref:cytochrome b/b6 domain-containing protein n=1 Tax=Parasphingorhabdus sp. TaxID=2709688 RepID=UPI003A91D7C6